MEINDGTYVTRAIKYSRPPPAAAAVPRALGSLVLAPLGRNDPPTRPAADGEVSTNWKLITPTPSAPSDKTGEENWQRFQKTVRLIEMSTVKI